MSDNQNHSKLWRLSKTLRKQRQLKIPYLKVSDQSVTGTKFLLTNQEKIESISKIFEESHKLTANINNTDSNQQVQEVISEFNNKQLNCTTIKLTKPAELRHMIKYLKNRRSPVGRFWSENETFSPKKYDGFVYVHRVYDTILF